MSIFSEVGKILVEESEQGQKIEQSPIKTVPKKNQPHNHSSKSSVSVQDSYPPTLSPDFPPFQEGEVVMDEEDMLRVVVINRVITTGNIPIEAPPLEQNDTVIEDDTFWESESTNFPEAVENQEESFDSELPPILELPPEDSFEEELMELENKEESIKKEDKIMTIPKSSDWNIIGDIVLSTDTTLHANIKGNISSKHNVTIRGNISGNVEANDVTLCGVISGSLKCKKLTLQSIGTETLSKVEGSLNVEALSMEFISE